MTAKREIFDHYNSGQKKILDDVQGTIDSLYKKGKTVDDAFFVNLAAKLSQKNVRKERDAGLGLDNIEGGPFGAVIIRYEEGLDENGKGRGRPIIVGFGANHVVPEADPSAHGEMTAIRDAAHRQGYSDLSGTVMFSSCECCPQCQAAVTASGIERLVYSNDRHGAHDIGFSDADQYEKMKDVDASMRRLNDAQTLPADQAEIARMLEGHGAMVLDGEGKVVSYDDDFEDFNAQHRVSNGIESKPVQEIDGMTTLPAMMAVRAACKKIGHFHLPEDYTLVSRNKPHPVSFITADWARLGRRRDPQEPENPQKDHPAKVPDKILYIDNTYEEMTVTDKEGKKKVLHSAKDIIDDVNRPVSERKLVKTEPSDERWAAKVAFKNWEEVAVRY